jgi:GTP:adenosylcobinamide-phosphate guanylyltransferase
MTNYQNTPVTLDAVVTAGGVPEPGEPLYELTAGKPKAMLEFAGKPMIQWVLDGLSASNHIGRIVVVGLPPFTDIHSTHPVSILETQGSILSNLKAGVVELQRTGSISSKVLGVSSDVPAITGSMIDWLVESILETDHDLYYNVISRDLMEKKFPNSKRTYLKFKDMEVCGGDVNAFDPRMIFHKEKLFEDIIGSRKNPLRQASILGFDTLFLLLIKQMTLSQAELNISAKIGARGRAIVCPYPEMGMDVDKSYQLEELLSNFDSRQVPG